MQITSDINAQAQLSQPPVGDERVTDELKDAAGVLGLDAKLTLPVSETGQASGNSAAEIMPDELPGFQSDGFFHYDTTLDGIVMRAPVEGAKTSANTKYARTEFRQMDSGELAAWSVAEGGKMSSTLMVTEMPTESDGGTGRIIVGQIHGENDELVRLYYDASGELYFANEITGSDGAERLFGFENAAGEAVNVELGETFSYSIEVANGQLQVQVETADGVFTATPTDGVDPTEIVDAWHGDSFYFKAGVYQGVNDIAGHEHHGSGAGEAVFFEIDMGQSGAIGGPTAFTEYTDYVVGTKEGDTIEDSKGDDVVYGRGGDDVIDGGDGSNRIYGGQGGDTINGGGGEDWIEGDRGKDEIYGDAGADTLRGEGGDDYLDGGTGDDLLKGHEGADTLVGGSGQDELWGNDGDDIIVAGAGDDWLKGGRGADTYVLDSLDGVNTIQDFSRPNGDRIDVSAVFTNVPDFDPATAMADGYVSVEQVGGDTHVMVDLDGAAGPGEPQLLAILKDEDASEITLADFIFDPNLTPQIPALQSGAINATLDQDEFFEKLEDIGALNDWLAEVRRLDEQ